ncbi:MAG TPA: imidazole glycerol phosphate synthase subunit HisF [Parvularcula sp.]|nr:imidazole glycerol phosphate synthase subunit HisF [Parvularcula sp.]HBS33383.1 imidazole glycerol phosphate synthase subunit HisF [Parvularcula sp.]
MPAKRIIACLDVRGGRVVKGVKFEGHRDMGDPAELSARYCADGADEIVIYDITASAERRTIDYRWLAGVSAALDAPLCVAGGIRTIDQAVACLESGADKVSINSPALERPEFITEIAAVAGSQCVVVGVDSRRNRDGWEVFQYTGDTRTIRSTGRAMLDWIAEAQDRGAGEIVLNCMDQDGVGEGYDIGQLAAARARLSIPLVASGGAGSAEHFAEVFARADVSGALAAGAFHAGRLTIPGVKDALAAAGVEVRR